MNQHIFKVDSFIDPRFHYYLVEHLLEDLQRQTHGSGMVHITKDKFDRLPVSLPPLAEQRRIIEVLDDHLSRLDSGFSGLTRIKQRIPHWRSSLLAEAVSRPFATTDREWTRATIGELADVGTGATPRRSRRDFYEAGTIPWITSSLLNRPYVDVAEQYITETALAGSSVKIWPVGTLLVAMYGEGQTRGRCSELRIPATTNQACAAIVLPEEHEERRPWLKMFLEATYHQNRQLASGGVQPNLNLGMIRAIKVPLPPLDLQNTILAEVDRQGSIGAALGDQVAVAESRAGALRRSLLREAFAGRLVVQDPSDEPASVLLARIAAERGAGTPSTVRRRAPRARRTTESVSVEAKDTLW